MSKSASLIAEPPCTKISTKVPSMGPWYHPFGPKVTTSGLSTGKLAFVGRWALTSCTTQVGTLSFDRLGHGTHVAGTIAALDNDIGVIGVAPEAEVFVVKFFADDTGFAYSSSLINAAYKCRDVGAKIISMSLGE